MSYLYFIYLDWLNSLGLKDNLSTLIATVTFPVIPFCIVAATLILLVLILVLMERKVLAFFTQRKGPNRVGPWGVFQTVADAIKLLCKENITPKKSDKLAFYLAPIIAFVPVMVLWGIVPFSTEFDNISFGVGILLFPVIALIPVLGILLAGYASNNKYSLVGSIRAVAQIISYEIPMIFVLLSVVVLASSMNLKQIVLAQISTNSLAISGYFIFPALLGFIIFFICAVAELNRCPFDLAEAESELVGGYNTEYSGMKFALFFLGEYSMLFVMSAFIATLFLGGFLSPFGTYVSEYFFQDSFLAEILVYFEQACWLILKTFVVIFLIMWVRATLPRLKSNQLMIFAWKILIPLSLINFLIVCIVKGILA